MKYILKKVGEAPQIMQTDEKYTSNIWQRLYDSYYERIWLDSQRTLHMIVDEEGLLKKLPTNFLIEMNNPFSPVQRIVGDIIVARNKPLPFGGYDYETDDITEEDMKILENILNSKYQAKLLPRIQSDNGGTHIIRL